MSVRTVIKRQEDPAVRHFASSQQQTQEAGVYLSGERVIFAYQSKYVFPCRQIRNIQERGEAKGVLWDSAYDKIKKNLVIDKYEQMFYYEKKKEHLF